MRLALNQERQLRALIEEQLQRQNELQRLQQVILINNHHVYYEFTMPDLLNYKIYLSINIFFKTSHFL
jgi:hypothetical protein